MGPVIDPIGGPTVEIRRSARRRRTVSAYRDGDRVIVLVPASLTKAEEQRWVVAMLARLERRTQRNARRGNRSDADLVRRAAELNAEFLDGRAVPESVRWVTNQNSRWGSCTPSDRSIRLSDRLRGMPTWVQDYVLVHELAHLLVSGHDAAFWAWVDRYPQAERAKGFLSGWAHAVGDPARTR
ncbi:MAG: M48 metallopeptidase family protein [Nocardioides sp.]